MPTGYEREYTTRLNWKARLRVGLSTRRGTVTRFVVQLEYRTSDEWVQVARFDHDPASEMGHDVTEEGLHLDVYRDGEKYQVERGFRTVDINDAIDYCETYLRERADSYVGRFERWHELTDARDR